MTPYEQDSVFTPQDSRLLPGPQGGLSMLLGAHSELDMTFDSSFHPMLLLTSLEP